MRRFGLMMALVCAGLISGGTGCSDDDNQNNNTNLNDAGVTDGETPDASTLPDSGTMDAGAATGCNGAVPDEPQPMGACCTQNSDCLDGYCLAGYCTTAQCETDGDCDPTVPGPFPGGVDMTCNVAGFDGFIQICVPGSGQACGAAGDSACPTGEACVLLWNEDATVQGNGEAMRGLCITKMAGNNNKATGQQCDDNADPYDYQCETPGGILSSCIGRRCTEACDPDNTAGTCPTDMDCVGPLAFDAGNGILSGGGICAGQLCGYVEATGDTENDVRIPGIDSECSSGEVCVPSFFTGVGGDTYEFRCEPSVTSYGAPGDACEQSAKFEEFCNHGTLCLQQSAQWSPSGTGCTDDSDCGANEVCADGGALSNRCAPKPDPGFCSMGCRTDADCSSMGTAYCLELDVEFPNGEDGFLTACYPQSELFETTPTACTSDADCDADAGEGCRILSFHSDSLFCGSVSQDATGTDCSGIGDCGANEACVEDQDASTMKCTAIQENGEACDPDNDACRGGFCFDSEFATDDGGSPTNTFCSGVCTTTADCGTNQVCTNVLFAENDPDVDTDDVVVGLCRSQVVQSGSGCSGNNDCTVGDTCNTSTGRCYTAAASWGGTCTEDANCPDGGFCDTDVPNGLCYLPGCDPQVANSCGAGAACSDQNVVGICLADCTGNTDCRQNDGFTCVNGACVAP